MLDSISIFLNLLRFDLWPKMLSILENVPCALEKNVYSFALGWNALKISMRFIWHNVSFKICVSLLIFCFNDLSIGVSGVLKVFYYYCVIVNFSFNVCYCLSYVFRCFYVGCININSCYVFLLDWSLDHYVVPFLISCNILYFKAYFVWYENWYSSFLLLSICMEYNFPSSHFQPICVFRSEVCFFLSFLIFNFSWRLITLQYCSGFCHTLIWISHGFTCVPHPIPLGHPSAPALSTLSHASNLDWWSVSYMILYMSQINPPSPSPTESKRLFYTSVSLLLSRI